MLKSFPEQNDALKIQTSQKSCHEMEVSKCNMRACELKSIALNTLMADLKNKLKIKNDQIEIHEKRSSEIMDLLKITKNNQSVPQILPKLKYFIDSYNYIHGWWIKSLKVSDEFLKDAQSQETGFPTLGSSPFMRAMARSEVPGSPILRRLTTTSGTTPSPGALPPVFRAPNTESETPIYEDNPLDLKNKLKIKDVLLKGALSKLKDDNETLTDIKNKLKKKSDQLEQHEKRNSQIIHELLRSANEQSQQLCHDMEDLKNKLKRKNDLLQDANETLADVKNKLKIKNDQLEVHEKRNSEIIDLLKKQHANEVP